MSTRAPQKFYCADMLDEMAAPEDDPSNHFTRVVSPVLAGFAVPAITQLAINQTMPQPWHDVALICLVAAAGLLLLGYQFSVGILYENSRGSRWRWARPIGSFFGLTLLIVALGVIAGSQASGMPPVLQALLGLAILVLIVGGIGPIFVRIRWSRLAQLQRPRP